jgi:hypothetical protein
MGRRLLLVVLVWLSCVWFGSWELNPNNTIRLMAAISLAERGDAQVDDLQALTIDKAQFGGHYYLDKAPGMTLLAIPAMALADRIGPPRPSIVPAAPSDGRFGDYFLIRLRLSVALVSAVLAALAALALHDLTLRLGGSDGAALFASIAFALGTPVWGWSTTLFGHAPVAALYVIAVWALWRGGIGCAALAGAALGLAALIEFQAVLAGSVIALWGAVRLRSARPIGAAALAGAATLLIPFVAYNLIAFGTPFRLGYQGVVGFAGMDQGLFGLTVPSPSVLVRILVGWRRGLLWVAPILVLAPLGLWWLSKRQRDLVIMLAAATLVVLLVNSAYFYWDGGHSTGPRHSIPAIGLLAIGLGPFWAGLRRIWQRIAATAVLVVSVAINLAIAAANITAPDTYAFPLWDPILKTDWPLGILRTLPSQFFGWSAFDGVALYLILALPLVVLLLAGERSQDIPEPVA